MVRIASAGSSLWRSHTAQESGLQRIAALTLALGIGANTAVFSLIDSLFLKPLAVPHPEQLVRIYARGPSGHYGAGLSLPELASLRDHASSFSAMSAETGIAQLNLADANGAEHVFGAAVSANYFDLLGIQPALGRSFAAEEDAAPGRDAVAIIGDRLWRVYFRADRTILGREIRINSVPFTVIGVAPPGFHGDLTGEPEEVWFPTMMLGRLGHGCADSTLNCSLFEAVLARLIARQSPAAAQAELQSKIVWSANDWPENPSVRQLALFPASSRSPDAEADDLAQMRLLIAVTASLLMIACANLAGLLLARGVTRRKEIAVRLAIGARRARVIR